MGFAQTDAAFGETLNSPFDMLRVDERLGLSPPTEPSVGVVYLLGMKRTTSPPGNLPTYQSSLTSLRSRQQSLPNQREGEGQGKRGQEENDRHGPKAEHDQLSCVHLFPIAPCKGEDEHRCK